MTRLMADVNGRSRRAAVCCALFCVMIGVFMLAAPAQAAPAAKLSLLSEPVTDEYSFTALIEVTFNDPSVFNDGQYVSYHVFASPQASGEAESLRYDNVRLPLSIDKQGKAEVSVPVDVTEFTGEQLFIQYDIVDTVQLFWFSGNENIEFAQAYTTITYSWWRSFFKPIVNAVTKTPFVFILNSLAFIATLITIGVIVKRKLLKLK